MFCLLTTCLPYYLCARVLITCLQLWKVFSLAWFWLYVVDNTPQSLASLRRYIQRISRWSFSSRMCGLNTEHKTKDGSPWNSQFWVWLWINWGGFSTLESFLNHNNLSLPYALCDSVMSHLSALSIIRLESTFERVTASSYIDSTSSPYVLKVQLRCQQKCENNYVISAVILISYYLFKFKF